MHRRIIIAATAIALLVAPATTAWADPERPRDRKALSDVEARRYARWWGGQVVGMEEWLSDVPLAELRDAAGAAWAAGASRAQLRAALFSDAAVTLFSSNAAGGQARPSPYLTYFANNPAMLGPLGEALGPVYVAGPGGTQDRLFAAFPGLRGSYLASLGLAEVDGRVVDPRNPRLSPYLVSLLMGPPPPLPQPAAALDVEPS